jgi:hypothetical protein
MQSSKYYDTVFHLKKEFTQPSLVLYLSFILVTWSLLQISLTDFFENNDHIILKIPSVYASDNGGNGNGGGDDGEDVSDESDDNGDSDDVDEVLSLRQDDDEDEDEDEVDTSEVLTFSEDASEVLTLSQDDDEDAPEVLTNTNEDTSDIIMESILKSGTVFKSNLYIPESNTKFTFSNRNELCPTNDCEYKFLEGELNKAIFGGKEDRRLKGTLQIEDKANSDVNFKAYNLYKVSGDLNLQTIKENSKTGEKIHVYEGELNIDKGDTIFNPEFKYQIQGKYFDLTKKFELVGEIDN